jgi:hypothetical protein
MVAHSRRGRWRQGCRRGGGGGRTRSRCRGGPRGRRCRRWLLLCGRGRRSRGRRGGGRPRRVGHVVVGRRRRARGCGRWTHCRRGARDDRRDAGGGGGRYVGTRVGAVACGEGYHCEDDPDGRDEGEQDCAGGVQPARDPVDLFDDGGLTGYVGPGTVDAGRVIEAGGCDGLYAFWVRLLGIGSGKSVSADTAAVASFGNVGFAPRAGGHCRRISSGSPARPCPEAVPRAALASGPCPEGCAAAVRSGTRYVQGR